MNRTPLRHVVTLILLSSVIILTLTPVAVAFPRTIVDGLGNEIRLEAPPTRIFSTGLAMDNLLLSVVEPARVVGVTTFATDPAAGSYVAHLISPHMLLVDQISPEYIIAANPDLVLVAVWNDPDAIEQIRILGYPIYTFTNFNTVQDALDNLLAVGDLTGSEAQAEALVSQFNERYQALRLRIDSLPAPRVLYFNAWSSTVGSGTTIDDIIRYAGGVNVISEMGIEGWPQIDYELIIQTNPQVIVTDSGTAFAEQLKNDPLLSSVDAVRAGRVYHVEHTDALDHNLILAIEDMAHKLHPEALAGNL